MLIDVAKQRKEKERIKLYLPCIHNSLVLAMDLQCPVPPAILSVEYVPSLHCQIEEHPATVPVPFRGEACAAWIFFQSVLDEAAGTRESRKEGNTLLYTRVYVEIKALKNQQVEKERRSILVRAHILHRSTNAHSSSWSPV
jgi:hypothetical protein